MVSASLQNLPTAYCRQGLPSEEVSAASLHLGAHLLPRLRADSHAHTKIHGRESGTHRNALNEPHNKGSQRMPLSEGRLAFTHLLGASARAQVRTLWSGSNV